ncbi:MAG: redoxin domain-containing protein [Planctomycetes bacterium]|nr:redoxin domain-containing protein [Planctomycetota bacterium]
MLPHEKELVERLKNRPFALIGINTDTDLDAFKERCKKENVSWRNSWQGSTSGPLSRAWGIRGYPTIYVLDHKGVIRYQGVRGEDMDKAVDRLLSELDAEKAPGPK